ncbi:NBAS subunit of NRZ tethering complex [Anabrus simplex]|uniref:NBAS subunit of NRZ tethering complex n=1 Tax=Anabrus simplex TaxID=316456 RepID=UPI0035A3ACC3
MRGPEAHPTADDELDECILYELLVYSEWKQDPEFSKSSKQNDSSILNLTSQPHALFKYLRGTYSLADDIKRLLLRQLPWQFAVGENGKVVAILQETLLEIRITRDEYSSVVGKAVVLKDNFPQWRKLAWSPDCSMLAIAHSNGTVSFYDLLGSNIFTIFPPKELQDPRSPNAQNPLASILFLQPRIKNPKWSNEVILIDYNGNLNCYLVSPTDGYQENHSFSFASHYRHGVAAVSYHPSHNLLFVAGASGLYCEEELKEHGSSVGLSAWRILNDYPYYRLALTADEEEALLQAQRSLWSWVPTFRSRPRKSMIFKMQVSPKGNLLACLHTCGEISIWHLPAIKLYRYWPLCEQPDFDVKNPMLSGFNKRRSRMYAGDAQSYFYPVDLNWWSEQAVIVARYSGAVSVCTVRNLCNLLGESPEFLAGQPQISALCNDRGFLGLECESILTSVKRPLEDLLAAPSDTESSDDEEDGSLLNRSSAVLQSAVYMITDIERFQPKRKRPKYLYKTYRLLGLKSTTPEELYARKIDNEEYGDALDLARTYNLDCDLVYQRQWRNSKVSINTIRDYLSKITKRSWVLSECIQRVPETFDAALELLEFGLRGTNLETLYAIGEGTDGGHFVLRSPEEEDDLSHPLDEESVKQNAARRMKELLSKIDASILTEEQRELLRYRRKLLRYLDMLRTYEKIEGEARLAEIMYNSAFYDKFRSESVITSTVEFAREGRWYAVKTMFTYHGAAVLSHWLPVLSNFPETSNPYDYELLLPECDSDGSVMPWDQQQLREEDWSEREDLRQALGVEEDNGEEFLYESDSDLRQFCCPILSITSELLSEWYKNRVYQIESRSCMVDHALTLVKLAQARNIGGLENLYNQLVTLESLVYDVHIEDVSLATLQKLTDFERAKLLMSKTVKSTFVEDMKHILLPFLVRCERNSSGSKMQVLKSYLLDLSTKDLAMPLCLFEHLRSEQPNALALWEDAVSLALDCVYTYPNADQLDYAVKILNCISERAYSPVHRISSSLHGRIKELECDLHAASILKENGIPKPVAYVRDCKSHATTVQQLLIKLARTVARQVPPPSKAQWEQLLNDMLSLQTKVFQCISLQLCYEIYAETLLSSGNVHNIRAASDILEVRRSSKSYKKVPFERSVALVLQVAREYFDSSGSLVDPSMELAKACLHLIVDEDEDIQENLDLIASLQMLNDFGLTMLPLHVRQCSDRMRLVEACIRKKSTAYRNSQRLLQLAQKLRVSGKDVRQREGKVLAIIAETALEEKDYDYCADICQRLVTQRHVTGWEVVQQLGQCQEFPNLKLRHSLLAFALVHCSTDMIEVLINTRCMLEAELLHEEVNNQVDLSAIEDEEFSDALTSPMSPQKEFPPSPNLGLSVGRSTEALKKTTYNLIQNISDKDYWKTTFRWGWDVMTNSYTDEDEKDETLSSPGFPEFYASLSPGCHASRLTTCYDRFANPDIKDNALKLCQAMLSILILEETAVQNSQKKISSEVFVKLAEHLLPEDCCLGLAHLLSAEDLGQTEKCLRNLPCTSVSLQLAVYYYALEGYLSILRSSGDTVSWRDTFLHPPRVLVDYVSELASELESPGNWANLLKYSQTLLADYLQGEQLQASGCGVDLERFANDVQYRRDSILGLALTTDEDRFQLALSLGARHGMPVGQIAAVYVSALFLSSDEIPLPLLTSRLNDPSLLELLRSQPHEVCERLTHHVYPSVCGTDHQLLILYFELLNSIAEYYLTHNLTSKEHIKLLKKVKATSPDIDYKKLVENPSGILEVLQPVLRKENVNLVAKLLKTLPENLGCEIKPGALYSLWAQLEFFQVVGCEAGKVIPSERWQKQYEASCKHFSKMTAGDLLTFGKGVVFSERSLDLMTTECRRSILQELLNYCNSQVEQLQNSESSKDWSEAAETFGLWLTHLHLLSSKKAEESCRNQNADFQVLMRQLDLSRGEAGPILKFLQSAVISSVPLNSLQMLLQLLPQPSPTARQLFEDMLNFAIAGIRSGSQQDALSLLPAVLRRLQESVEQRDANTAPADAIGLVWKQLEPLCGDKNLTPEIRLQALNLLQSLKVVPEDTGIVLLFHHTQAAVALAWPGAAIPVLESELTSESARHKLFERLLAQAKTWQQICTLKDLLDKWPPFENPAFKNASNDPWLQCLHKVVNFESGNDASDQEHILEDIFKKNSFSEECLQDLVTSSESSVCIIPLLLTCLLSDYGSLHRVAATLIQKYYRSSDPPLSPWLCSLLLQKGLVSSVVGTPAYSQLVQHLLNNTETAGKLPDVDTVCEQLIVSGNPAEAGTLKLLHMGAPPALTVFSTALSLAKRMSAEE